jgi:Zn-dependent peptidase ImmA (M78 family)
MTLRSYLSTQNFEGLAGFIKERVVPGRVESRVSKVNIATDFYDLKALARRVRAENNLTSPRVLQTDLRKIYFRYGIEIDYWPYPLKSLRGAFICDEFGTNVMLAQHLPNDPMVFTMAHELKHYLTDRHLGISYCDQSNINKAIEIGAEVFASELLFPDYLFANYMRDLKVGRGKCKQETLVQLKMQTRTTLSYAGLAIKAERLNFAAKGSLTRLKGWRKLEKLHTSYRKNDSLSGRALTLR